VAAESVGISLSIGLQFEGRGRFGVCDCGGDTTRIVTGVEGSKVV
jgi:hypothetical protein